MIETGPQSQNATGGKTFTLTCQATGYPVPSIEWTLNGAPLTTLMYSHYSYDYIYKQHHIITIVEGIRSNTSVLVVSYATAKDTGIYQCIATNGVNNDTQDALVIVRS